MGRGTAHFWPRPLGPWEGSKGKISLNFHYKVNFKDFFFIPNVVCVLTNERYKTCQTGFSFEQLGHTPGFLIWGAGASKGSKMNMVKWHIKLTDMTSRTECK